MITYKFQIYCETDAQYEHEDVDSEDPTPTVCPINAGHTINSASISVIEVMRENQVYEDMLPEHNDNAAALSAGLVVGQLYRTVDAVKGVH